jgi:superfamily I DNA and/or RNA helicase
MRTRLRKLGMRGVDVGNVEAYQGREFKVAILSPVRSNARFLAEDKRTNMGLYNERRRLNVALTRSKDALIIVGNANLLKVSCN